MEKTPESPLLPWSLLQLLLVLVLTLQLVVDFPRLLSKTGST
jgi:hypothetical protein